MMNSDGDGRIRSIDDNQRAQGKPQQRASIMAPRALQDASSATASSENGMADSVSAAAISDITTPSSNNFLPESTHVGPRQSSNFTAQNANGASNPSAAMGAQAAAAFLQQYFAQQPHSLPPAEAGTMQHTLWQLQQAMQQQPHQQQSLHRLFGQPPTHQQTNSPVPLRPAPAPAMYPQQNHKQQNHHSQPQMQLPSTISLCSSSIPGAVIMNNNGRKRKSDDNVLQFSDAASKSLKRDHARSNVSSSSVTSLGDMGPPKEKTEAELKRMTPAERRRYDRNLREQQRSYRISQQIKTLREVLSESGVPFKPNKFSILVSVSDYIKNLQQRSILLDAEQKKLADTIRRTSEMVASGQVPSSEDDRSSMDGQGDLDRDALSVHGLDYRSIFQYCPFASGVASLDGRILYANQCLEQYFGAASTVMEQQSLFLYIRNHQDVFEAMADILRRSSIACETGEQPVGQPQQQQASSQELLYWCGPITSHKNSQLQLNITLSCAADGNPKYFSFSVGPGT